MSTSNFIKGLLIGVGVGILIAPSKGSESRKKISNAVDDLSDYITGCINEAREEVNDLADSGIETVKNAASSFE